MSDFIITSHAKEFSCAQCGRCCRNKWQIPIDEKVFEQYKELSLKDPFVNEHFHYRMNKNGVPCFDFFADARKNLSGLVSEQLLKEIIVNPYVYLRSETENIAAAARLVLEKCQCSFLTQSGLCYIHATYGTSSLSSVCLSYPRLYFKTIRGIECGISYSCPAAVKLLNNELLIDTISDFHIPLPNRIRELDFEEDYFHKEDAIIDILKKETSLEKIFTLIADVALEYKPPAVEVLTSQFSGKTAEIISYAFGRIRSFEPQSVHSGMQEVMASLLNGDDVFRVYEKYEGNNIDILRRYFENYFFTKSFYSFRNSFTDSYLMLLLIYNLIRFTAVSYIKDAMYDESRIFLEAVRFVENNVIHNSSLTAEMIGYLSDWY